MNQTDGLTRRNIRETGPALREIPKGAPARFRWRRVHRCAPEGCSFLKIAMVVLVILGLCMVASRIVLSQRSVKPYRPASNHFANSLSPYVIPGYRTLPHGRTACQLGTPPISEKECRVRAAREERILNNTLIQHRLDLVKLQEENDKAVHTSGGIMLGMRPVRLANYKRALEHAEKVIIQRHFSFQNPEQTIALVKTLNRIICEGLPLDGEPGVYRTYWNAVTELAGPSMKERLLNKASHLGTKRDVEIIQNSLIKFKDGFSTGLSRLNQEELTVFKKFMTICPPPEEIEGEMLAFAHALKEMAVNGTAAIDIGCFVHCELGRIHPFSDGQGREGRGLLVALLKRGGVMNGELVFSDINQYAQASLDEMKHPGAFKRFVMEALNWTKAHRLELDLEVNES